MAFVNEFVSEDDVKKYGLNELWLRWHPVDDRLPPRFRHAWTVDRERDAFFIPMLAGRFENAGEQNCVLFWREIEWQVDIAKASESSGMLRDNPFKVIWKLLRLQPKEASRENAVPVLKEALTVFGYNGIHRQIPNTIVEFEF